MQRLELNGGFSVVANGMNIKLFELTRTSIDGLCASRLRDSMEGAIDNLGQSG